MQKEEMDDIDGIKSVREIYESDPEFAGYLIISANNTGRPGSIGNGFGFAGRRLLFPILIEAQDSLLQELKNRFGDNEAAYKDKDDEYDTSWEEFCDIRDHNLEGTWITVHKGDDYYGFEIIEIGREQLGNHE